MKTFLLIIEIGLSGSVVRGQPPENRPTIPPENLPDIQFTGPTSVKVGELVRLDASQSTADNMIWELATFSEDQPFLDTSGKMIYWATRTPGRYTFVVAASILNETGAASVAVKLHTVEVTGDKPLPPGPGPAPIPDLPDGEFGLAKFVYQQAAKVGSPAREKAKSLSQTFSGISSQIAAGALRGKKPIIEQTAAENRKALGETIEPWRPFFEALNTKLQSLNLETDQQHATAWREISIGLAAH